MNYVLQYIDFVSHAWSFIVAVLSGHTGLVPIPFFLLYNVDINYYDTQLHAYVLYT